MAEWSPLPWRRPRREWLVLGLVALAALTLVYGPNAQDNSRLCLAQAIVHGRLSNDGCFALDHSRYNGHDYSDKAPGLSLVEIPVEEAVQLQSAAKLPGIQWKVWLIRILTVGIPFLVLVLIVGRISEGLAPGFGSISMATFALGTLVMPFAAISFDQVPSGLLGFGAFLLAWQRKHLAAGLAAGAAVLFEYETELILAVVALYILAGPSRWRSLGRYALG